jgi:hypothetical protein
MNEARTITSAPVARPGLLLTLWIALISADRLDLLGAAASFTLTPFLVLTPILVLVMVTVRHAELRSLVLPRAYRACAMLALALVVVAGASVFVSPDPTVSGMRALLLTAQILGALGVVALLPELQRSPSVMIPGVKLGVVLFALFDVLQSLVFLGRFPTELPIGPAVVHLVTSDYAGFVPRLSGSAFDPNRGGILLVTYLAILLLAERRPREQRGWWIALVLLLLLGTLSRSAALAVVVLLTVRALQRARLRAHPGAWLLGSCVVTAASAVLLFSPGTRDTSLRVLEPLSRRVSLDEGSAQSHLALLRRGVADATSNVPTLAIGRGFGSSYVLLQDLFPGSRYGNYHSLYVSLFAESGILALLLVLPLTLVPAFRAGPYRPLVAAFAVFNVFYQLSTEPLFWFVIVLSWSTVVHHIRAES